MLVNERRSVRFGSPWVRTQSHWPAKRPVSARRIAQRWNRIKALTLDDRQLNLIAAQADLHKQYFIGLQLMVATREGPKVVGDWMYELFRRQHEEKFLSSFKKLGLDGQSDAVAAAKYHALSNGVGGVTVEYMEESQTKAWVRYRYPRWWLDGPAVCGIPVEASQGFMRGWHAHNGVSLGNPRLGFVCVSEDMTGEFGLCGYFREFEHELSEQHRLQYAKGERPPEFRLTAQPHPPAAEWSQERLAKANRNYAIEFVRNGISALIRVVGRSRGVELGATAARLIGLQQYVHLARSVDAHDGDVHDAAHFLAAMFEGMGDNAAVARVAASGTATVKHEGLRIVRNLEGNERRDLLTCWIELWKGTIASHRAFMDVNVDLQDRENALVWVLQAK